eukprot:scaffold2279_cov116-Isochrysis_galbana.AAC.2
MTDPPIDDTQAREPDAPGTHDAKLRAPVHGHTHTGDVPPDKALSDRPARGLSLCLPCVCVCATCCRNMAYVPSSAPAPRSKTPCARRRRMRSRRAICALAYLCLHHVYSRYTAHAGLRAMRTV